MGRPEDVEKEQILCRFTEIAERSVRFFTFNLTIETDPDRIDLSTFGVRPYSHEELFERVRPLIVRMVERTLSRCHLPWSFVPLTQSKSRFRNISVAEIGAAMAGGASLLVPGLNIIIVPAVAICTMVDRAGMKALGNKKNQKVLREHSQELLDLLA